jgi:atypical dual specificity phosphatase
MSAKRTFAQVAQSFIGRGSKPNPNGRKPLHITTTTTASIRSGTRWASEILPRLYLSDVMTASDVEELDRLGVTHIVTVMETPLNAFTTRGGVGKRKLLHIPIPDIHSADLLQHLDETSAFINDALNKEETVVLVRTITVYASPTTLKLDH